MIKLLCLENIVAMTQKSRVARGGLVGTIGFCISLGERLW